MRIDGCTKSTEWYSAATVITDAVASKKPEMAFRSRRLRSSLRCPKNAQIRCANEYGYDYE
jgi:hypothetical protein